MKNYTIAVLFLLAFNPGINGQTTEIKSPDGKIKVGIEFDNGVTYTVSYLNKLVLQPSVIDLKLDKDISLSSRSIPKKMTRRSNESVIISPVPEKRKRIPDVYNELTIRFGPPLSVQFRIYNDGIAYRFISHARDSILILDEVAEFNLPENHPVYFTQVVKRENADIYHTSFEEPYEFRPVASLGDSNLIFTPTLVASSLSPKIIITESDLFDYPGMFLKGTNTNKLKGVFAGFPLEEKITEGEFPQAVVTKRANHIAATRGSRSFPWRVIMLAAEDKDLPANDLVYRLGAPTTIKDLSWIKPGQATDEWIIGINLFNVPFKSGINTATYKYYIDFAKRFGFERIMMDAGWSDYKDLFKIHPDINMDEISAYAREKGIGLSMWTLALTLDRQLEPALAQFAKWNVDFIMTDFMDRDDQQMVNFYHRIAEACARHKIMVMYHGGFKPAGFSRTWPNAITREGVLGSEYNIWSSKATPEHDLLLPFIRMTAGPMDYEPGILDNATAKTFRPISEKVMSMGTRCHQAAMFVVYESPIQVFSGNPSQGYLEPKFMELLGSVPTTWDTTVILDGKVGDYIITARRKGDEWFIGSMTDWSSRELNIGLSFLGPGSYELVSCEDGVNGDRYPADYVLQTISVTNSSKLTIRMAPGGGYVSRIRRKSD